MLLHLFALPTLPNLPGGPLLFKQSLFALCLEPLLSISWQRIEAGWKRTLRPIYGIDPISEYICKLLIRCAGFVHVIGVVHTRTGRLAIDVLRMEEGIRTVSIAVLHEETLFTTKIIKYRIGMTLTVEYCFQFNRVVDQYLRPKIRSLVTRVRCRCIAL